MSQLNLFLSKKKFTTSAMSFFLSKVRESSLATDLATPPRTAVGQVAKAMTPSPAHPISRGSAGPEPAARANEAFFVGTAQETLAAAPAADFASGTVAPGPCADTGTSGRCEDTPASLPPAPPPVQVVPLSHEQRKRRKAKRRPPPPGCMCSPASASSSQSTLPVKAVAASGGMDDDWELVESKLVERRVGFRELERRLEQELEAAREREVALQAALRERAEALSELVVCPITHEPMVDPVSTADGNTYERRAIEEWLLKGAKNECGVPISPLTGEPLKDSTLRPNFLARALRMERSAS